MASGVAVGVGGLGNPGHTLTLVGLEGAGADWHTLLHTIHSSSSLREEEEEKGTSLAELALTPLGDLEDDLPRGRGCA